MNPVLAGILDFIVIVIIGVRIVYSIVKLNNNNYSREIMDMVVYSLLFIVVVDWLIRIIQNVK